ncbi:hypothetical protein WJX77_009829 [Trebouxia sp. C0004]
MSEEDTDQPRAKRRRCAPKRFLEEDDESTSKEGPVKLNPLGSSRPQQQSGTSWKCDVPPRHLNRHNSEDEQALYIIQQLAAKLERHERPQLATLLGVSNHNLTKSASIREALPLSTDVTEAAACLVSFGC